MNGSYVVTVWAAGYVEVARCDTFAAALAAYALISDRTKQLVNEDLAECGRDGLTEDERDQVAAVAYAEEKAS